VIGRDGETCRGGGRVLAKRWAVRKGRAIRPQRPARHAAHKKKTARQPSVSNRATIGTTDRAKTGEVKRTIQAAVGVGSTSGPIRRGRRWDDPAAIWNADWSASTSGVSVPGLFALHGL
jgi:hypothetical protein